MNWKRIARKLGDCRQILKANAKASYAQVGEDLIVSYLFQALNIDKPTYLEIGTNHPIVGNNTFYFYSRGSAGVCVEPDPDMFAIIKAHRPMDVILNMGIGVNENTHADFFAFPPPYTGWNSFSMKEAEKRQAETGIRIRKVTTLPLISVNEVMLKYFEPFPNFISLDVEGLDLDILHSLDFDRFHPEVVCVESVTFSPSGKGQKISAIGNFLESKGYFAYADTFVNTIFCRKDKFEK